MKKGLKIMGACLIVILSTVCFCSCSLTKDKTFVYDDFFVCIADYGQPGQTAILELTELGKEQEVLIIPETINGQKIVWLGGYVKKDLLYPDKKCFSSTVLRKLYIPIVIDAIYGQSKKMVYLQNATIITLMEKKDFDFAYYFENCKLQVLPFQTDFNDEKQQSFFNHLGTANCLFFKNDKIVWIDYIADGEVYALPAYLQIDWYLEPECINLWNGEYVIPDGQERLNLYSK